MQHHRADYPPDRLARAAGPFGEELALLGWADRLAAQGPRLKPEHVERHREVCVAFLRTSRGLGPYPEPDYAALARRLSPDRDLAPADLGYAASAPRLFVARGSEEERALACASRLL